MDVVRDVLDTLVVDRNGRQMGRVDGILLDLLPGDPPRLSAVLIGPAVLGSRLHPTIGRWIAALEQAFGVNEGRPVTIDFHDVKDVGREIKTNVSVAETAAGAIERRLRAWLANIPERG